MECSARSDEQAMTTLQPQTGGPTHQPMPRLLPVGMSQRWDLGVEATQGWQQNELPTLDHGGRKGSGRPRQIIADSVEVHPVEEDWCLIGTGRQVQPFQVRPGSINQRLVQQRG